MSGLNYMKLGNTLSNICIATQLDDATKCHYALKNSWGEPRGEIACYEQFLLFPVFSTLLENFLPFSSN